MLMRTHARGRERNHKSAAGWPFAFEIKVITYVSGSFGVYILDLSISFSPRARERAVISDARWRIQISRHGKQQRVYVYTRV